MELDTNPTKHEWEEVLANGEVSIFQTPEMKEVFERTRGYEPITLSMRNGADGRLVAVLLGVVMEVRGGMLAPFSRWSTARGGPCFVDREAETAGKTLLEKFEVLAKRKGALFSRLYPLYRGHKFSDLFKSQNWQVEEVYDFISDLTQGSDGIWEKMKGGRRKNIRNARKRYGIETTLSDSREGLETFLSHFNQTCMDRGLICQHESYFEAIYDILVRKGYAHIFLAGQDGEHIASKIILTYRSAVYDWYAGALPQSRKFKANDRLLWDILDWSVENGFRYYYYGGAETTEEVQGIFDYKKTFGGELVSYDRYVKIHKPVQNWMVQKLLPLYKRIVTRKKQ